MNHKPIILSLWLGVLFVAAIPAGVAGANPAPQRQTALFGLG